MIWCYQAAEGKSHHPIDRVISKTSSRQRHCYAPALSAIQFNFICMGFSTIAVVTMRRLKASSTKCIKKMFEVSNSGNEKDRQKVCVQTQQSPVARTVISPRGARQRTLIWPRTFNVKKVGLISAGKKNNQKKWQHCMPCFWIHFLNFLSRPVLKAIHVDDCWYLVRKPK